MAERYIKHEFFPSKDAVRFNLDCSEGCTKRALEQLILELQEIHKELVQ